MSAVPHLEQYHGTDTFLTEALTIEANARVAEAVDADQPFFLYFAHYAVHAPFHSDSRFAEHYANSGQSPQAQAFATLIEGMDKSLGDVLDQIASLGVAEDTVIFFLGDNGSDAPLGHQHAVACAAPLRGKKGSHYEGGMRVPFIAAWVRRMPRIPISSGCPSRRVPFRARRRRSTICFRRSCRCRESTFRPTTSSTDHASRPYSPAGRIPNVIRPF